MQVTREQIAEKLSDYLSHHISLAELVDWAEEAVREGEFHEEHFELIRDIVTRLGLADVRAFGLTWEDCEAILQQLGYQVRVEVTAARS